MQNYQRNQRLFLIHVPLYKQLPQCGTMRVSPIMYCARKSYRYKLVDRHITSKNILCTVFLYVLCIEMMAEVHKNKISWMYLELIEIISV